LESISKGRSGLLGTVHCCCRYARLILLSSRGSPRRIPQQGDPYIIFFLLMLMLINDSSTSRWSSSPFRRSQAWIVNRCKDIERQLEGPVSGCAVAVTRSTYMWMSILALSRRLLRVLMQQEFRTFGERLIREH
jgi:hypothetical protein